MARKRIKINPKFRSKKVRLYYTFFLLFFLIDAFTPILGLLSISQRKSNVFFFFSFDRAMIIEVALATID